MVLYITQKLQLKEDFCALFLCRCLSSLTYCIIAEISTLMTIFVGVYYKYVNDDPAP